MTKNYFVFDGTSSKEFNTFLASSTMFNAPERDTESIEIPGRNGTLMYDNGRYRNFEASVYCYVPANMQTYIDGLRAWLMSKTNYCRYEDTIHPDEYRMARYTGAFELEQSDRSGASITLSFDCKPQRFYKSGEIMTAYNSGAIIYNPTRYDALPLIVCAGNGTITLNGTTITISGNTGQIYIDCDIQNAYLGNTNKNSFITSNFPKLSPGQNTLTYSGVTGVQMATRWWTT